MYRSAWQTIITIDSFMYEVNMSTSLAPGASLVDVEDVVAGGAVGQLPRQRRAAVRVKYLLQHEQLELVHGDGLLHHDRGHHAIRQQYLCKQA